MIRSKPKTSTLFSLLLFLMVVYGIGIWTALRVPSTPAYWYLIPITCLTTAIIVTLKVLLGYKTIQIQRGVWTVTRLLGRNLVFNSNDIDWWRETEIKTGSSTFKQLQVHNTNQSNVKISLQEQTDYLKIHKYLLEKHLNKQKQDP